MPVRRSRVASVMLSSIPMGAGWCSVRMMQPSRIAMEQARFSRRHVHPRSAPEQRRITIALPDTSTSQGVGQAISAVLAAVSSGEIASSEARDMIAMLESRLKAIEVIELEARIAKLEARDRENRFPQQSG